jgi:hypothetical protein
MLFFGMIDIRRRYISDKLEFGQGLKELTLNLLSPDSDEDTRFFLFFTSMHALRGLRKFSIVHSLRIVDWMENTHTYFDWIVEKLNQDTGLGVPGRPDRVSTLKYGGPNELTRYSGREVWTWKVNGALNFGEQLEHDRQI